VKMVGGVGMVMGREKELKGELGEDKEGRRETRAARLIFQRFILSKNSRRPS
jgi:hypothetical protein